ncbi:hypothetical protein V8E36_002836 [Tilletia maclaganii]
MHSLDHQNLRRIDAFFRPVQADRCAWQNGCDEIQSALDAVTAQRGQASVVNAYLARCEANFEEYTIPILDKILDRSPAIELEIRVEMSLSDLHQLMQTWRSPLELAAFTNASRLQEFDVLFGRRLRAAMTQGHLTVISEIMQRLIQRVSASNHPVIPGSFVPSSTIWVDLGIADVALTMLIIGSKRHMQRQIRGLCLGDLGDFSNNELSHPAVLNVLNDGPYAHRVLPTILNLLRDTYGPIIKDWLQYLHQNNHKSRAFGGDLEGVMGGLYLAALESLSAARSRQVFDIIMDFPASQAAVLDLKDCLHLPDSREAVITELNTSIRSRLLHPGAQTSGIILIYLRMVSGLRLLDESGVILSRTAPPLRRYLRTGRSDTVTAIVTALVGTDPEFESLREELRREGGDANGVEGHRAAGLAAAAAAMRRRKGKAREGAGGSGGSRLPGGGGGGLGSLDVRSGSVLDDEGDAEEYGHFDPEHWKNPNWQPRPVDAGLNFNSTSASDIVNMLVSIFDDEATFVTALERSTAAELIRVKGYAPDKEYHNNLILKKRFGEAKLARCDVMLSDFPASRRIDQNVHELLMKKLVQRLESSSLNSGIPPNIAKVAAAAAALHPLILSRQFWPSMEDGLTHDPAGGGGGTAGAGAGQGTGSSANANRPKLGMMKMPGQLGAALSEYAEAFAKVKSTRKVHWLRGLGSVDVELEMDDGRVIRAECTPAQAAVVEIATSKASESLPVTIEELVVELEADKAVVAAALKYWVARGVLREVEGFSGTYEIIEVALQ